MTLSDDSARPTAPWRRVRDFVNSLAGRLLALTALAVIAGEIFVFAPALAGFHEAWLRERINIAQVASLAVTPEADLAETLQDDLLNNAGVQRVALQREGERVLLLEAPGAPWEPFTPKRLAELRAGGTPVFVNFTAAWCITCLVNERVALHSPAVAEAFARKGVVYLKADWTSKSPEIAALLESFGRSGVPLYVVYGRSATGAPRVLPQILSETGLVEAIESI